VALYDLVNLQKLTIGMELRSNGVVGCGAAFVLAKVVVDEM
jgi:hypothetical protein